MYSVSGFAQSLSPPTLQSIDRAAATAVSPSGEQLLVGSTAGITIHDLINVTVAHQLTTEIEHVHDLKFSSTGDLLVAAGGRPGESGTIECWQWPARQKLWSVTAHDDVVFRIAWTDDGRHLVTAGFDQTCLVVKAENGQVTKEFLGHARPVLAIGMLDNRWAVSGGVDQVLRVWDIETGQQQRELTQSLGTILDLVVLPASTDENTQPLSARGLPHVVTIGSDRTVRLWQPSIGRLVRFAKTPTMPKDLSWDVATQMICVTTESGQVWVFEPSLIEPAKLEREVKQ
jgi:WD40 repeat protein